MYDVIIVGGGPAGLTSALYAKRAGKTVLIIEKNAFGGQIAWSPRVENYPAIKSCSGLELADRMTEQALSAGADTELDEVVSVTPSDNGEFSVKTASENCFEGRSVVIAVGARPRALGLDREEELTGAGVSYCAVCDGAFYKDREVAVCGGGNSALQDALFLSDLCKKVTLIHRRDSFRGDASLVSALKSRTNVELLLNTVITRLNGADELESIEVKTKKDGNESVCEIGVSGLFVAVGHEPQNAAFSNVVTLNADGYAASDESCAAAARGVFVAGDCRAKSLRQLTTAVSDGASAAVAACRHADEN